MVGMTEQHINGIDKVAMGLGYFEMGHINLLLSEDAMMSESSNNYNDGGTYSG
jgi:hypothetical protein